jgi:hypothetical protein
MLILIVNSCYVYVDYQNIFGTKLDLFKATSVLLRANRKGMQIKNFEEKKYNVFAYNDFAYNDFA